MSVKLDVADVSAAGRRSELPSLRDPDVKTKILKEIYGGCMDGSESTEAVT